MKKIIAILAVILILSSCSLSGIVKGLTGGAVDVGSNMKWPKDKMGSVPEVKGAKINSIYNVDAGTGLLFTDMSAKDAEAYYKKLKEVSKDISIIGKSEDNSMWFTGQIGEMEVAFTWYDGGAGGLICAPREYEPYDYQTLYGDEAKWDTKILKNIPELKGITVSWMYVGSDSASVYFTNTNINSMKSYVSTLKSAGFSEDYSYESEETFSFSGSKGDTYVSVSCYGDSGTISVNN